MSGSNLRSGLGSLHLDSECTNGCPQKLTRSLAKEDHPDYWPARRLKWSQNSKEDRHVLPGSFLGTEVVAWNFVMASQPALNEDSDNAIVFWQYYANRQEKFWSNLAHKQQHWGVTTRCHAGVVALKWCPIGAILMNQVTSITAQHKQTTKDRTKACGCHSKSIAFQFAATDRGKQEHLAFKILGAFALL